MLCTVIGKNLKTWDACLSFVEFAYNRSMHSTMGLSHFEIVYDFNPLTPLDLIPLPISEIHSLDGKKKAKLVKSIHEKVRSQIAKRNEQVAAHVNKGRRQVLFDLSDWVWVHLRKERFPNQRKSKLNPKGDGPFRVFERINDNVYKI